MYINKIEWLDKECKEAILKVVSGRETLICFSCPCLYNIGDVLNDPLECLDIEDVVLCCKGYRIEKMEGEFAYKLKGELRDIERGIVKVYGFELHIDEQKIPKDMINGTYIQFRTSRIDMW